jgi:hypothetical protein
MKLKLFSILCLLQFSNFAFSQTENAQLGDLQFQTIRGFIRDKESQRFIVGARISIENSSLTDTTHADGSFTIKMVPLGRQNLIVEAKNYKLANIPNIVVTSGKEVILNVDLDEDFESISEVSIKAKRKNDQLNNDAALVSARLFTVDETDRFAGSRGDPARMASNFAGVQGADDSRNDIVVRGNSPSGILWRMEGIDIPNPNHFAIPGTTGGSVSIINNKILGNSDFFTGAFPSEYGNAIAGVFDLKLRNGNNQKHEFSSQLGFLGWDFMAEGPLSKKSKASYLFTYRYSTLSLFSKLNIPIGTDAVPNYQDASFKINIPLKNNANLSFFGIGGNSSIDIKISDQKSPGENLYGDNDRDQYFTSNMGIAGASYQKSFGQNSYFKWVVSVSGQEVDAHHDLIFRTLDISTNKFNYDSIVPFMGYNFRTFTQGTHFFVNQKISPRTTIKYGLQYTHYNFNLIDTVRDLSGKPGQYWTWDSRWNSLGSANMLIPYFQWKYKFTTKLSMVAGWQAQVYQIRYDPITADTLKKSKSHTSTAFILPRLSFRYQADKKSTFNLGLGIHSQNQPSYVYFYDYRKKVDSTKRTSPKNIGMELTKSAHVVLGWDYSLGQSSRIKLETYYQYLWDIPIDKEFDSTSFSLANTGSGFSRFFPNKLVNEGTAYNYGIELTLEKFFSKGFYYLFSASLFDAQYTGSDGVTRPTDFNTNYAVNALFAKEYTFKNKSVLNIGGKITLAGARRFSPMDTAATIAAREYIENDELKNTQRFGTPYSRFDVRISYKINGKKVSHEFALDLVNVTNQQNILKYSYSDATKSSKMDYQLGFLPLFYYKLDFSL